MAKVLNVPDKHQSIAGIDMTRVDYSLIPKKFQTIKLEDVDYIFYDGKFAMTYSHLKAANYDQIRGDIDSRYPQVSSSTDNWNLQQLEENPDTTELQTELYKRGPSNTRIYLLKRIDHDSDGMNITSAHLVYVPTFFFFEIGHDIATHSNEQASADSANQAQTLATDAQKVQ
jgi:hypothetical protein